MEADDDGEEERHGHKPGHEDDVGVGHVFHLLLSSSKISALKESSASCFYFFARGFRKFRRYGNFLP